MVKPQGLKPSSILGVGGTAEAVPFPSAFFLPARPFDFVQGRRRRYS